MDLDAFLQFDPIFSILRGLVWVPPVPLVPLSSPATDYFTDTQAIFVSCPIDASHLFFFFFLTRLCFLNPWYVKPPSPWKKDENSLENREFQIPLLEIYKMHVYINVTDKICDKQKATTVILFNAEFSKRSQPWDHPIY